MNFATYYRASVAGNTQQLEFKDRRGIAQSGSAPALGAGCREFESLYPDHFYGSCKTKVLLCCMRL